MAPQKRARNHEDDAVIAVESARSSLRPDARKRARLSENSNISKSRNTRDSSPSSSSSSEDEEDNEEPPNAEDAPAPPPSTQYEFLRDDGFRHLENPDLDDQRATQKFLARKEQIGDNHAANNAIVEDITCINFMCHERLHVPLGPLINFVVGENGSGKSAVLTALTLCLGGKAAATNRGASLKSLIKTGCDSGLLIVRLKNQGNDAYQPDVFGKSIIIERHFSRSGSSNFKLKNENGRLISNKKGDVEDIIEYFQLQVDNPMNVLTQDAAKSFITSSTPAQKYQFFFEGVQLKALDDDYRLVSDTCDQIEAKLDESVEDLQALKKIAKDAEAKAEVVRQHAGIRQEAKRLSRQLAWAQVEEQERVLAEKEQNIVKAQEEIDNAEREAAEKDRLFQEADQQLDRVKQNGTQLEEELVPLRDEEEKAKADYNAATEAVQNAHTEQKTVGKDLTAAINKVKKFEHEIEEEQRRLEAANGGAHARTLEEVQEAKRTLSEAHEALEQHDREMMRFEEAREQGKVKENGMKGPLATKRKEVDDARERLSNLNSDRGNDMAGFDPKMSRVLQQIRNDAGFREKPIGPLGRHIRLLKSEWSHVLESTMNAALTSFIVTSKPDQMRLSNILRQNNMTWCQVAIVSNEPLDHTGHEPDPQYDTVLRVLDIENDLIKKHLIISQAIEQTILVPDRKNGIRIMFEGPRPRNVKQCFCINDQKRAWGFRLGYMGGQSQNREQGPIKPPKGKPKMKTQIESQIAYQTETVRQLERERDDLENKLRQVQESLSSSSRAVTSRRQEQKRLKLTCQRAQERIDNLEGELDTYNIEDGRLEGLRQNLADAEQERTITQETYGNMGIEKEKLNLKSAEEKKNLAAVKKRLEEHETKLGKVKQKLRSLEQVRMFALTAKNHAITQIEELSRGKAKAKEKYDQQAVRVTEFIAEATKICPRIPVDPGETEKSLEAKLNSLDQQLKAYRRRQGGSDQEINDAAVEANGVYVRAKADHQGLEELLALLKQSFLNRMEMYRRFQTSISARSRINFAYLLSERAFRGKLTIDHKNKKLDVHVQPDDTVKGSKGRQTKTLSGGEKSFSSVCLLLSLWEAMGAPLRCLDEYDVFMDDVNRDVTTKMIISAARRSVGRQFILITPKALGNGAADIGNDQDVKITRMTDPRERRIDDMLQGK
ncbi:P-loop containing nucleoside triphosphate hydrolase protein [Hyaloscypha hepaticicola]|uniref:P-loop containing nucleoside triphosphate hydrolase protein n=1 Tax=Hyaloscypha hepaticicola TaxID=2082293 RepID=A0A2J6PJ76_9HELO|nr:P-loop containing nucleoside triphosphate hydrolase protein [Hyaloscypha hepaticicola]